MSELYNKKSYISDIRYIVSSYIREYDIKQANINILLYKNIINEKEYNLLSSTSRSNRQINVGYLLKDPKINETFENALKEIKKLFIEENNLEDKDILAIKNDAIYIINKVPKKTIFNNIEFILKNSYTTYMRLLRNLEIYYNKNDINNTEIIDVKGIDNNKLELHKNYLLDFIMSVLYHICNSDYESAIDFINYFYDDYINLKLHINYYRNFNSFSTFELVVNNNRYGVYQLEDTSYNKSIIDISYNANIIREIYGLISSSIG